MIKHNSLVNDLISLYYIWKDANTLLNNSYCNLNLESFLNLPCFHFRDIDDINNCASEVIIIDNLTESVHSEKYFKKYKKNKHYIIFSAGYWDKEKYDIDINYDLLYLPWWLFEIAENYLSQSRFAFFLDKHYNFDYPKQHIFCSIIGSKKKLRSNLVDQLLEKLTYENYILKYESKDMKCASNHLDFSFIKSDDSYDPHKNINEEYNYSLATTLPMNMCNSAYFNLVVETDQDWYESFFITEKTLKVLLCGMPFVVFATPYFLKNLQDIGFRTYNTLWDESYDSVLDHSDRINKIVELAQTLEHFDWQANKIQLQEIFRHNIEIIMNRNIIYDEFFKNLEQTMIIKYNEAYNV